MSQSDDPVSGTRAAYEAAAVSYSLRTGSFELYPGLRDEVEEFAVAAGPGFILEIGSGSGRDLSLLEQHSNTVAFDLALNLLRLLHGPRRVQGNVLALPFKTGAFDAVWCSAMLLHLPESLLHPALTEVARVTRSNGLVAASVRLGLASGWRESDGIGPRWFTSVEPDQLLALCGAASLGVERHWVRTDGDRRWLTVWSRRTV